MALVVTSLIRRSSELWHR